MTSNCFIEDQIEHSYSQWIANDEFEDDLFYHYLFDINSSDFSNQYYQQNQQKSSQNVYKKQLQMLSNDLSCKDSNNQKIQHEISSNNQFFENSKNSTNSEPIHDNKTSHFELETSGNHSSENKGQSHDHFLNQKQKKRKYQRKKIPIKLQNNSTDEQPRSSHIIIDDSQPFQNNKPAKNRKGKHSQSKTQKFIHFMTKYHYSKNFNQFFKKRVTEKVGDINNYQNSSPTEKIDIINEIIQELYSYNMAIHYSVQKGEFFQSFSHQQQDIIRRFFHKVIRKTYQIKLELQKKRLENTEIVSKQKKRKFFQQKSEREFTKIFQSTLHQKMLYSELVECDFEYRLQQAFQSREHQ